eukprot:TRINITY_DN14504_c0_g1_i1.p1 TRINITY_DN14504_c0_g1~~TRINITY_DN14504_c0_g1_i1.p1  ORF type:complete len:254 (-),score=44.83 TRINITY_DN14504_c0_g1_i1:76-738(-)
MGGMAMGGMMNNGFGMMNNGMGYSTHSGMGYNGINNGNGNNMNNGMGHHGITRSGSGMRGGGRGGAYRTGSNPVTLQDSGSVNSSDSLNEDNGSAVPTQNTGSPVTGSPTLRSSSTRPALGMGPAGIQAANSMMLKMKLENHKAQLAGLENGVVLAEQNLEKARSAIQVAYCSGDGLQEERAKQGLAQAKQMLVAQRAQIQAWKAQKKDLKQALKASEKK